MAPGVFIRLCYKDFPPNTLHLCLLHIESRLPEKYVFASAAGQYFLAPDNGVLPIGLDYEYAEYKQLPLPQGFTDVLKEIYVPAIQSGTLFGDNSSQFPAEENPKKYLMPSPTVAGNTWRLAVLCNDSHGNAYLNMNKTEFERITAGHKFQIKIGFKQQISKISTSYYNHSEGDMLALFGLGDLLQICINCGSALQYLGLKPTKLVMMEVLPNP